MNSDVTPDIVVMGASAGGVQPLRQVVSAFPAGMEAAVFIALHTLATAESLLPELLSRETRIPAVTAQDRSLIEVGKICVAPPDRHLLFHEGALRVTRGPKENRHRPSIDVLFRSAAMAYGPRVIGVLLSGADDDGTAGMMAIKRCGGITIVQDPAQAEYPEMPSSALRTVQIDFTRPVAEIGPLVQGLVDGKIERRENLPMSEPVDESLAGDEESPTDVRKLGIPSVFTCPDCNGTLWELQDGELLRYRCRVGHAYSAESIIEAENDSVERSLWEAVKTLEESAQLSRRIAQRTGLLRDELMRKAAEREQHARVIRNLLVDSAA
jgi:two-component system chemotaxis response regulator CheB